MKLEVGIVLKGIHESLALFVKSIFGIICRMENNKIPCIAYQFRHIDTGVSDIQPIFSLKLVVH